MSLEILYHAFKDKIESEFLACVAGVHFSLISNGFKCVSMGEKVPPTPPDGSLSDMLPADWSSNKKKCSIIYWNPKAEFYLMLKMFDMDSFALAHVMKEGGSSITDLDIEYKTYIGNNMASFKSIYKEEEKMLTLIKKKLLEPALSISPDSSKSPRDGKQIHCAPTVSSSSGLYVPPERDVTSDIVSCPSCTARSTFVDPILPSGRCDLDPLAGQCTCGRGGMIFDPLRIISPGRPQPNNPFDIPPGSVPPGARFDPIGPPFHPTGPTFRPRSRFEPSPDEMRPPRFGDRFF